MGNVFSGNRCSKVNVEHLNQTGFDNFTEVSSVKRDARIEKVSDESFGKASNLLKVEDVDQTMVSNDSEENTHGWLTKRHELVASVKIALCNNARVHGLDIDTTGYIDCCPSYGDVEGYRHSDKTWQTIVPVVSLTQNAHNFYRIYSSDIFSHVRLNTTPAGGIARFRTYGEIVPEWSNDKEYNLASANLGASIVRWTDSCNANRPNILMNNGIKMSDGWLTPRSRMSKERNDFILIQLATPGKLNSIAIDTTGFDRNSPTHVFVQGCYSKDTDPQYDAFSSWISMVSESPILPGGMTSFDVSDVTDEVISHIRLYVMPDGGIQQVKVFGVPVDRNYKKGRLLLEQGLQPKAIKDKKLELDQDTVSTVEEILFDRPVVEQLNLLPVTPSLSRSESSTSPPITEYASDSTTTVVTSSQEVKIEEIEIEPPVLNTSRHTSPSSNPRKRKSVSQESSDSPEETSSSSSSSIKKQRGRPRKTVA